jgi:cellulose synthase/poly-beta-1,6-N-acetylglucosamine synthase-like glycosyltransferase
MAVRAASGQREVGASPEHAHGAGVDRQPERSAFPELDPIRGWLSRARLAEAECRAAALNIGADRVVTAGRFISEDDYLRNYAAWTGIVFEPLDCIPRAARLPDADEMLDAAAVGILPLIVHGELIHVVAPCHLAARRMLQLADGDPQLRRRLRVTSAPRLHRFIVAHCGGAWGAQAADALRAATPLCSAARLTRPTAGRWWAVLAALAIATAISAPEATMFAISIAFSLLFLAWMVLRLLGVFVTTRSARQRSRINDADLPLYTVIAALYREAASVEGLVRAIRQIDWPPEKLEVKLVLEADDLETRAALARLDLDPRFEIIIAPADGPRTKPKALNAALCFARGTFTVVYDAEDRPEPGQLRAALHAFLRYGHDVACVQAALTIDNTADSWLARMFTLEYAAHFDVLLPSLAALRLPLPLGGSSNHFRTASLRAINAWDPYNVTEDADLGMRLARCGYRSATIASTTYEEAPAHWCPWLKQRTRWFKGWTQTWLVHMRAPAALWRDLGPAGFAIFQLIVGGSVLVALLYPAFAALFAARLIVGAPVLDFSHGGLHTVALIGGLFAYGVSGLVGLARRRLLASAWVIVLAPLYWLLLSLAAWRAVLQLWRDPFRWEKTEHGLARTSRRARHAAASLNTTIVRNTSAARRPPPRRRA